MHLPFKYTETCLVNMESMRYAIYLKPLTSNRKLFLLNSFAIFLEKLRDWLEDLFECGEITTDALEIEVKQNNYYYDILNNLMEMQVVTEEEEGEEAGAETEAEAESEEEKVELEDEEIDR